MWARITWQVRKKQAFGAGRRNWGRGRGTHKQPLTATCSFLPFGLTGVLLLMFPEAPAKGPFSSNGYFRILTLLMSHSSQKPSLRATQSDSPFGMEVLMTDSYQQPAQLNSTGLSGLISNWQGGGWGADELLDCTVC